MLKVMLLLITSFRIQLSIVNLNTKVVWDNLHNKQLVTIIVTFIWWLSVHEKCEISREHQKIISLRYLFELVFCSCLSRIIRHWMTRVSAPYFFLLVMHFFVNYAIYRHLSASNKTHLVRCCVVLFQISTVCTRTEFLWFARTDTYSIWNSSERKW